MCLSTFLPSGGGQSAAVAVRQGDQLCQLPVDTRAHAVLVPLLTCAQFKWLRDWRLSVPQMWKEFYALGRKNFTIPPISCATCSIKISRVHACLRTSRLLVARPMASEEFWLSLTLQAFVASEIFEPSCVFILIFTCPSCR